MKYQALFLSKKDKYLRMSSALTFHVTLGLKLELLISLSVSIIQL